MTSLIPSIDGLPEKELGDAWAIYMAAVTSELARLNEWRDENGRRMSQMAKRRGTIWGRAWQAVMPGLTLAAVHKEKSTCSYDIFKKKWQHQPLFMDVLKNVTALTVGYIDGKTAAKLAYRRDIVIEREWNAAEVLDGKVTDMIAVPLGEAKWTMGDAVRMAQASSVLGRRATGMDITGVAPDTGGDDDNMELTAADVQKSIMDKLAKMRAGIVGASDEAGDAGIGDDEVVETAVGDEEAANG